MYGVAGLVLVVSILWAVLLPSQVIGSVGCEPGDRAKCVLEYDHRFGNRVVIVLFGSFLAAIVWALTFIARNAASRR